MSGKIWWWRAVWAGVLASFSYFYSHLILTSSHRISQCCWVVVWVLEVWLAENEKSYTGYWCFPSRCPILSLLVYFSSDVEIYNEAFPVFYFYHIDFVDTSVVLSVKICLWYAYQTSAPYWQVCWTSLQWTKIYMAHVMHLISSCWWTGRHSTVLWCLLHTMQTT